MNGESLISWRLSRYIYIYIYIYIYMQERKGIGKKRKFLCRRIRWCKREYNIVRQCANFFFVCVRFLCVFLCLWSVRTNQILKINLWELKRKRKKLKKNCIYYKIISFYSYTIVYYRVGQSTSSTKYLE